MYNLHVFRIASCGCCTTHVRCRLRAQRTDAGAHLFITIHSVKALHHETFVQFTSCIFAAYVL